MPAWSTACSASDPSAGLADSGRPTYDQLDRGCDDLAQPGRHVAPGAHVLRLLLKPDDLVQLWVGSAITASSSSAGNGYSSSTRTIAMPLGRVLLDLPDQVDIDLAATQDQPGHFVGPFGRGGVVDHRLELSLD